MTGAAPLPPWISLLEGGLPVHLLLPTEGLPEGAIADLCGALFAFMAVTQALPLGQVGASLCRALEADQPQVTRALARALRREESPRPLVKAASQGLLSALARGEPLSYGLSRLLSDLPDAAAEVVRAVEAWSQARRALSGLVTWLGYLQPADRADPTSSRAVACWNEWLVWTHGRRSGDTGREAPGRPHHFALLLLALSASQRALWWYPRLHERLETRHREPQNFGDLLRSILLRQSYIEQDEEDIRAVPLSRAIAAWGLLGGEAATLTDALERLAKLGKPLSSPFAAGLVPPIVRFDASGEALRPLLGAALAPDRASLRWIAQVLRARKAGDAREAAGGLPFPAREDQRVSAALAHALHESADNFAARIMPSVAGWRRFWPRLRGWLAAEGAPLLAAQDRAEDGAELPFATWRMRPTADGEPLSASRLYIELCRARDQDDLEALLRFSGWRVAPGLEALLPSLREILQSFVNDSAAEPWYRAAYAREQGLRWPGEPQAVRWDDTRLAPTRPARPWSKETPPCAACVAIWRGITRRATELGAADPVEDASLAQAVQQLHARLHAGALPGACPRCAAQLLPHAAAAAGAQLALFDDAQLLVEPGQDRPHPRDFEQRLDALTQALARSIRQFHEQEHPARSAAGEASPPLHLTLRLSEACASLHCTLNGQRRAAEQDLRGVADAAALTLLRAASRRFGPQSEGLHGQLLGAALGELLLSGAVGRLQAEARGMARASGARIHLGLSSDALFSSLPLELLRDPDPQGRFLGLDGEVDLIRVLERTAPPPSAPTRAPQGVLFATAGLPDEVVAQELAEVRASKMPVRLLLHAGQSSLAAALAQGPYEVLHLACHGEPGRLRLADGELSARGLAAMVAGRVSTAAVVNACLSASPGRRDLPGQDWSGVAAALMDAGVPHVVAQGATQRHDDAVAVAAAWFLACAASGDPVAATRAARRALHDRLAHTAAFGLLQHFTVAGAGL